MKTAKCKLRSTSPYSQGRYYKVEELEKESKADYEKRTWRERLHADKDGNVFIPPMAFKNCLSEAAKFLSLQIQGKGKATYTKHFEAGVIVMDGPKLGIKKNEVEGVWHFVPASGRRGDGKRVEKCFPTIPDWEAEVTFHILDETITEKVFEKHLEEAGRFIGLGVFRPRNNGFFGRFEVESVSWSNGH